MRIWLILGAALVLTGWRASAQKSSFEVASVKLNVSESDGGTMGLRGDTFVAINIPLITLLTYAYSPLDAFFLNAQILGGPAWIKTDRFDIQAKVAGIERVVPEGERRTMLQSLLENRFQVKAHREKRDLPVYNLVLVKNGPKLSEDQTPPDPSQMSIEYLSPGAQQRPLARGAMRIVSGPSITTLTGTALPIERIVRVLQGKSDRIIIDKTGLKVLIDIHIEFSQDAGPNAAPLLFTAIQDLGLKLESAKAPMDVLVVDSVQKPSEN